MRAVLVLLIIAVVVTLVHCKGGGSRGRTSTRSKSPSRSGSPSRGRSPTGDRNPSQGESPSRGGSPSGGGSPSRGGSPSQGRSPSGGGSLSQGSSASRGGVRSQILLISRYGRYPNDQMQEDIIEGRQAKPAGPKITRQPLDILHDKSSSIRFVALECIASGTPEPSYYWTRDGNVLPANERYIFSQGRLRINFPERARFDDDGSYQCIANNSMGAVFSREAELRFAYIKPYKVTMLPDKTISTGNGACISCSPPEAYPGIVATWMKNGQTVNRNKRVKVSMDGRLCFAKVENQDSGEYYCFVQNIFDSGGSITLLGSPHFTIHVSAGADSGPSSPYVYLPVQNVSIQMGKTLDLECFYFGDPVPELLWRRISPDSESHMLPAKAKLKNHNQLLQIRNIQPEHAGTYECYINSSDASSVGTVTVLSPPSWIKEISDKRTEIYSSLLWTCEAESDELLEYVWYKNTEPIGQDGRYVFDSGFQTLRIESLEEEDSGTYQCVASSTIGKVITTAQLFVRAVSPNFPESLLENQPAARGGEVIIECNPDASPKPTIKWFRGQAQITPTEGRFNITEDGDLIIYNVQDSDGGDYRCVAENSLGTEESTGNLLIKEPTTLVHKQEAVDIRIGGDHTLRCVASADPGFELIYIWTFNNIQINFLDNPQYSRGNDGNLILNAVTLDQGGQYTCRAETALDADSHTFGVVILAPPDPPTGIIVGLDEFMAELTWVVGVEHGDPTTGYVIQSKTNHEQEWVEALRVNTPTNRAVVSNLSPWSEYQFRILAVSQLGEGAPSKPAVAVPTGTARPDQFPTNVGGGKGNPGDLRITWQPLEGKDHNAPGLFYKVSYKEQGSQNQFQTKDADSDSVCIVSENVPVYTPYEVKVQAVNDVGEGPFSETAVVYSYQEKPPSSPTGVTTETVSGTSIRVGWKAVNPDTFQGELEGYNIYYWPEGSNRDNSAKVTSPASSTSGELMNLSPNTRYEIVVVAVSGGGDGPDSSKSESVTLKNAPMNAPVILTISAAGSNVKLTWKAVSIGGSEEPLQGYHILYWDETSDADTAEIETVGKDVTAYTLKNTIPKTTYYVKIRGFSKGGDGAVSEQMAVKTSVASYQVVDKDSGDGGGSPVSASFSVLLFGTILLFQGLYLFS